MYGIQIRDVDTTRIRCRTLAAVFLNVHAKKADVDAVNLFEREQRSRPVGVFLGHFAGIDKPKV